MHFCITAEYTPQALNAMLTQDEVTHVRQIRTASSVANTESSTSRPSSRIDITA